MSEAVIVSTARTPIGKAFRGAFNMTHGATLGGHVVVEDFAQISAYSGVHQFCRVGRYAFIGGYSVVKKLAAGGFGVSASNSSCITASSAP